MSNYIKCDKCGKMTKADSTGEKRYKISVDGFDRLSTFHLCGWCLRDFYLNFLGWVYNSNTHQYEPKEEK